MLQAVNSDDVRLRDAITQYGDPFTYAPPCWTVRILYQLPDEFVSISITERKQHMALRTVKIEEAPQRLKSSFATTNTDMADVMAALGNPNTDPMKMKVALVVDMSDAGWTAQKDGKPRFPKPEVALAYALRRRFEALGVALTAYQSGKMQVTVRRKTAVEMQPKKKK